MVWVNSWHDPGKEADAAKTLIDQGADIISQHTDSAAPLQIAEQRGVFGFGQAADQSAFAPKGQLTAIIDNWSPYCIARTQAVLDGTWQSHNVWYGLKEGMVEIAPYGPSVPPEVAAAADTVKNEIIAGTRHPFTGPIMDQSGDGEGRRGPDHPRCRTREDGLVRPGRSGLIGPGEPAESGLPRPLSGCLDARRSPAHQVHDQTDHQQDHEHEE